jgi:hypothetical protein
MTGNMPGQLFLNSVQVGNFFKGIRSSFGYWELEEASLY